MNHFLAAAGLALLLCGCTTTKAIAPEPDDPRPTTNQVPSPPPSAPAPTASVLPFHAPDDDRADKKVGLPCGPKDASVCGTKGRIASGFASNNLHDPAHRLSLPCDTPVLDPNHGPGSGLKPHGCVKDDRLYVGGSCLECRIFSEWVFVAIVPEMTDAQLREAQARMRLPKAPLLRTTSAWASALDLRQP